MDKVPYEIFHKIASFLPFSHVSSLAKTNRHIHNTLKPFIWRHVIIKNKGNIDTLLDAFNEDNTLPKYIHSMVIRHVQGSIYDPLQSCPVVHSLLQLLCLAVNLREMRLEYFEIDLQMVPEFLKVFKLLNDCNLKTLEIFDTIHTGANIQLILQATTKLEILRLHTGPPTINLIPLNIQELCLNYIADEDLERLGALLPQLRKMEIYCILENDNDTVQLITLPHMKKLSVLSLSKTKIHCPCLEYLHVKDIHSLENITGGSNLTLVLEDETLLQTNCVYSHVYRCQLTDSWYGMDNFPMLLKALPCVEELVIESKWAYDIQAVVCGWTSLKKIILTEKTEPFYGFVGFKLVYISRMKKVYVRA